MLRAVGIGQGRGSLTTLTRCWNASGHIACPPMAPALSMDLDGAFPQDPRLRQCGFGIAAIAVDSGPLAFTLLGSLPGRVPQMFAQIVNNAELYAAWVSIKITVGNFMLFRRQPICHQGVGQRTSLASPIQCQIAGYFLGILYRRGRVLWPSIKSRAICLARL